MMCVFKKIVKTRENFRIYVQISGHNSNFRTFQDKFQNVRNFRTTPRPGNYQQLKDISKLAAKDVNRPCNQPANEI